MKSNLENTQFQPKKEKDRKVLFTITTIILLGILIFLYYTNNKLQKERRLQQIELNNIVSQLDSISGELDQKILTISQLGGEIDTLLLVKKQLETEKKELFTRQKKQKQLIIRLQGKVNGYKNLMLAKDVEIQKLKKINEELLTENVGLKTEKQELNQSIREVNKAKEKLAEKVKFASRLELDGMKVFAVNTRGKEKEASFRNKNIDKLKITFTVGENKIAPIERKGILIRIIAPDGNVIFDVAKGSGSFIFEGRDQFFSAKQEILYDKNSQEVTAFYDKGSDYEEGRHSIEVYTDDYLVGKGFFTVK